MVAFVPIFWERFRVDWDTVRGELRASSKVTRDEPNMFAIQVIVPVEGKEMTQDLGLAVRDVQSRRLLTLIAPVCPDQRLRPPTIVQYQDRLPFGALVVRQQMVYLRHDVLLETLTPPLLSWMVGIVAYEAIRVRVNLRVPATDTFAHFTEE